MTREKEERSGEELTLEVPQEIEPERLDKYLGNLSTLRLSRSQVQKLISRGLVTVDGETVAGKYRLGGGEVISLSVPAPENTDIKGENIALDVIFEDDHLLVINKPAGMVTHPGVGNRSGTLANGLVYHFERLSSEAGGHRPGIVHRLDKNTSGLLVVAKDDNVHRMLAEAIQSRELKRTYLALICGHLKESEGEIDLPIGRSSKDRTLMSVNGAECRDAVTRYKLRERYRSYDFLEVALQTGRTHQIRVHFAHLGHPVLGDPEYGGREKWVNSMFGPERPLTKRMLAMLSRQALHATRLEFKHPVTGEQLALESPVPDDYAGVLETLKNEGM